MRLLDLFEDVIRTDSWWATSSGRYWYHPKTDTLYAIPAGHKENHTTVVYDHPELFGIPDDELSKPQSSDYDGAILFRAMQEGWVRVFINRRNVNVGTNVEGIWLIPMAQTIASMRNSVLNGATRGLDFSVIQRLSSNDRHGTIYTFNSIEQIDEFILTHRIPSSVRVSNSS